MSGGTFASTGKIATAPTTVWFGAVPDRLNMLGAQDLSLVPGAFLIGTPTPAHYASLWSISAGVSFGATTTAPDGTTANSPKIIEDTSTGLHLLTAATVPLRTTVVSSGMLRLAGFFKYAGRRVVLECECPFFGGGIYAVFDLAGGQVGVPATVEAGGNPYHAIATQMTAFGDGWYLCYIDFWFESGLTTEVQVGIYLDNGTGTAPLSNSYTGNGTAGIYGWRTNMMPRQAYGINTVTFFDDFNDLSSIDLANTKAAGFKWYVNNAWTNTWTAPVTQASWLSVNSSVLQIVAQNQTGTAVNLMTTVETAPGSHVGTTFKLPYLLEFKAFWGLDAKAWQFGSSIWALSQEALDAQGLSLPTLSREFDYVESGLPAFVGTPIVFTNTHANGASVGSINPFTGTPSWLTLEAYAPGYNAQGSDGQRYQVTGPSSAVPGTDPISNPGIWHVSAYPGDSGVPNTTPVAQDLTSFRSWSFLCLPWAGTGLSPTSFDGIGGMLCFVDGLYCGAPCPYSPFYAPFTTQVLRTSENQSMPIIIGSDAASPGAGVQMNIDYVRVMQ